MRIWSKVTLRFIRNSYRNIEATYLGIKDKFNAFLLRSETRWTLPFTALAKAVRRVDKSAETILDVGCGRGFPARLLSRRGNFKITGIEIYIPYLLVAKDCGAFTNLVLGDLRAGLPFKDKTFDVVICIEVIEHLEKEDGIRLISELERVAKRKVILTAPVGYVEHPLENGNPFSIHRSSWYPHELKVRGYTVRGTTLRFRNPKNFWLKLLCYLVGVVFCPLAHFRAESAFGMVAEKRIN